LNWHVLCFEENNRQEIFLPVSQSSMREGETMRRIFAIAVTVLSLALSFPMTLSASDNNQKSQTKYDYVKHSHDNYQKSLEKYQKNPTNQNRQIMKQRKQIYEMRKRQFGSDKNK
jgi:hypothetical protein